MIDIDAGQKPVAVDAEHLRDPLDHIDVPRLLAEEASAEGRVIDAGVLSEGSTGEVRLAHEALDARGDSLVAGLRWWRGCCPYLRTRCVHIWDDSPPILVFQQVKAAQPV
ncbi:hypothetical protein OG579_16795 [Williamsia herbipolensis]|uniref:Uncharacterized protein n=1 Tax=Williamsia herbipolensis TaxID=1603258 RepID=A0AAU4JZW1_9NOCA|nr:hypothetical protein [Williamsia herbipolensis]